jgi:hypothetical protein
VTGGAAIWVLSFVWIACSTLGGALLALLARRLHPALSFSRLWLFYSTLLGLAAAAFFALAWW